MLLKGLIEPPGSVTTRRSQVRWSKSWYPFFQAPKELGFMEVHLRSSPPKNMCIIYIYINNHIYIYIRPTTLNPGNVQGFKDNRGFPESTVFFHFNIFTYCPTLWVRTTCHMTAEFVLLLFCCQGWVGKGSPNPSKPYQVSK